MEKHLFLSKAKDAVSDVVPQKNYYKNYIADFSTNVYVGDNALTLSATGFHLAILQLVLSGRRCTR